MSTSNYSITVVNGILTVVPAAVSSAANEATRLVEATAYGGSVTDQTPASSSGTLPYDNNSQGPVDAGTDTLILHGLPSDTYSIGYIDGTLAITSDSNEIR